MRLHYQRISLAISYCLVAHFSLVWALSTLVRFSYVFSCSTWEAFVLGAEGFGVSAGLWETLSERCSCGAVLRPPRSAVRQNSGFFLTNTKLAYSTALRKSSSTDSSVHAQVQTASLGQSLTRFELVFTGGQVDDAPGNEPCFGRALQIAGSYP